MILGMSNQMIRANNLQMEPPMTSQLFCQCKILSLQFLLFLMPISLLNRSLNQPRLFLWTSTSSLRWVPRIRDLFPALWRCQINTLVNFPNKRRTKMKLIRQRFSILGREDQRKIKKEETINADTVKRRIFRMLPSTRTQSKSITKKPSIQTNPKEPHPEDQTTALMIRLSKDQSKNLLQTKPPLSLLPHL